MHDGGAMVAKRKLNVGTMSTTTACRKWYGLSGSRVDRHDFAGREREPSRRTERT